MIYIIANLLAVRRNLKYALIALRRRSEWEQDERKDVVE